MAMPWQLREGLRRHPKGSRPPRPIAEQLPHINVNHLKVPRNHQTHLAPNISLRYPLLASMRIAWNAVEFTHKSLHRGVEGPTQCFALKQIRTGLGGYFRHAFICTCGRPTIRLYIHHQRLACRRCHNAIYASQTLDRKTRPALQANRIASFLEKTGLRKQTRERLTRKLGEKVMRAQGRMGSHARGFWEIDDHVNEVFADRVMVCDF